MANLNFKDLLDWLSQVAADVYKNRNDASRWDASVEQSGKATVNATLQSVSLEAQAFEVKVKAGDATYHLKAVPGTSYAKVYVDTGEGLSLDSDARLVYRPVGSLGNPYRFHLDFKRVTVQGEDLRFNLAYPKG